MRPGGADGGAHRLPLGAAQIVHHHSIAGGERRHQNMFDAGPEGFTVNRAVQHEARVYPTLIAFPPRASAGDVMAQLFACQRDFL